MNTYNIFNTHRSHLKLDSFPDLPAWRKQAPPKGAGHSSKGEAAGERRFLPSAAVSDGQMTSFFAQKTGNFDPD
jgi:hypothetical protein